MSDLRTKLRHHSDAFGQPGYALRDLEVLKARRDRSHRLTATAVAFGVIGLTSLLLWGAFAGSRTGNTGHGPMGAVNGRISFIVGELGGSMDGVQIATAEPDGSDRHTLIEGVPEYLTGGWSPDGRTIVFSRAPEASPDGHVHLWRINADGSGLEQLTDVDADDFDAQFSPDGAQILFIADTPADDGRDGFGIYVMRADGTNNSKRIVPSWTVDVESGGERQVTDTPTSESLPAWSVG